MPKPGQLSCRPDTLIGPWLIEPGSFNDLYQRALAIIDAGQLEAVTKLSQAQVEAQLEEPYTVDGEGIANVLVRGALTQYPSSMQSALGGTSMLVASRALREVADSPQVRGILIEMNSPGGTAAGAHDFAAAVKYAASKKPTLTHTPGMAASGGYFVGMHADRLTADPMAVIGSVGAVTQLRDTSELMRRAGITNYYPASGDRKAAGAPGTPITTEQLADAQKMISDLAAPFIQAVQSRRELSAAAMKDISRAGLYVASQALEIGLIDGICTSDQAREQLLNLIASGGNGRAGAKHNPAVQGTRTMLNAQQLEQAKSLPGCSTITAENADVTLLAASLSLQSVAVDATNKTTQIAGQLTAANGKIAALEKQVAGNAQATPRELAMAQREARALLAPLSGTKLSPACHEALAEAMIGKDNEPVVSMLTPDATGNTPASKIIGALAKNEGVLNADGKQRTGAQPVARQAPGAPEAEKPVTPERKAELLSMAGLRGN